MMKEEQTMDAKEFMHAFRRMCDSYDDCEECPLDGIKCTIVAAKEKDLDKMIDVVAKWAEEHPTGALVEQLKEENAKLREKNEALLKEAEELGRGRWVDGCELSSRNSTIASLRMDLWALLFEEDDEEFKKSLRENFVKIYGEPTWFDRACRRKDI